jgi:hypothetical protein
MKYYINDKIYRNSRQYILFTACNASIKNRINGTCLFSLYFSAEPSAAGCALEQAFRRPVSELAIGKQREEDTAGQDPSLSS